MVMLIDNISIIQFLHDYIGLSEIHAEVTTPDQDPDQDPDPEPGIDTNKEDVTGSDKDKSDSDLESDSKPKQDKGKGKAEPELEKQDNTMLDYFNNLLKQRDQAQENWEYFNKKFNETGQEVHEKWSNLYGDQCDSLNDEIKEFKKAGVGYVDPKSPYNSEDSE